MSTPVIPPDTAAPGQTGHVAAHNEISDVLTWLASQVTSLLASTMPLPQGSPSGGAIPVVATVSPLSLTWGAGGGGTSGNIDGGTAGSTHPASGIDGGSA